MIHGIEKIPFMLLIGEKEIAENTVSVRKQGERFR
ncbi:MAG: hypothetical protein IPN99_05620 [Bacteroidetes bacterium]|nr:hypothetical protein [Bacteroidota bacterium]